jgi:hypothetical protein
MVASPAKQLVLTGLVFECRPGKGKKLWEGSADNDQRWPHDMFEKLNLANDVPPQRVRLLRSYCILGRCGICV